ncbi:helix-turn-helix domain-containing protein [Bacteroides graminisolvens]
MKTLCLLEEKLRDPLALSRLSQFRYIEVNKKESVQNINREHEFLLCFVLKGSVCILKNKIDHAPCVVMQDEVFFVSNLEKCSLKAMDDSCVLIHACNVVAPYLHSRVIDYLGNVNMDLIEPMEVLPVNELTRSFLDLLVEYMERGIQVPDLHRAKEYELFALFKISYSRAEIASFFHKALTNNLPFFVNVMTNYKFCRTSKELAVRCNYNEPAFSRVFKEAFRDTPYRWLQKQTAAEIEFKLKEESVPIKQIMLEH